MNLVYKYLKEIKVRMNLKNRINREEIMIRKKQISMFRK